MDHVVIYTDGACSGNPGVGGWGAVLMCQNKVKEIFGGETVSTNNRMELTAVIKALEAIKRECTIEVYTDSKYVQDGITKYINTWKKNGWKTAAKKPVKNLDLWQELDSCISTCGCKISWSWVKGHADNVFNNRADELARAGVSQVREQLRQS